MAVERRFERQSLVLDFFLICRLQRACDPEASNFPPVACSPRRSEIYFQTPRKNSPFPLQGLGCDSCFLTYEFLSKRLTLTRLSEKCSAL